MPTRTASYSWPRPSICLWSITAGSTTSRGTESTFRRPSPAKWATREKIEARRYRVTGGSSAISVTRAFWLLVSSGDVDAQTFICPASQDTADPALVPEWYYDFEGYHNISYGYQVPFGPRGNRPSESARFDMPLAADKGPYYLNKFEPTFQVGSKNPVEFGDPFGRWRRFNSPNHNRQGQNVLFADASVSFERTPAVGIHGDNIYTLMVGGDWDETGFNRIHGESPHFATVAEFPYPGQDVFGVGWFSSTDSLIYP